MALQGFRAPFRLVQDHSRSGRLEAPSLALRAWLFSDNFAMYLSLVQVGLQHRHGVPSVIFSAEGLSLNCTFTLLLVWSHF